MRAKGVGALIAVTALALTGCQESSAPVDPDQIGGTVTLWYLEDPVPEFLEAVKAGFEDKYPGTKVEMTEVPEDGFVTKIDTALLAKEPPDVAFIYESRWMKAGSVMKLDDVINAQGIDTANMNQVALSECELDGHLYCLGSLTGSVVLLYNKDLFDKAKVAYPPADKPMTIDEYDAMARQLQAALGKDVYGGSVGSPYTWAGRLTHFSEDGRKVDGFANDPSTLHLYDVLGKLSRDKVSPTAAEEELTPRHDLLGSGKAAMAVTDFEIGAKTLEAAGARWGAAPPPVEKAGDDSFVFVGTDKYGAFTDSKNPATAKALVAYIGTEGSKIRAEKTDQPPLDATMLQAWAGTNESRQEVVKVLSTSTKPGLFVPGFWEVTSTLSDIYAQILAGETDTSAIQKEAPELQKKLDREWETWENIK
ncbi:ABC transporter substrate-binding protein [Asanoa iriomotensis]|uniref:ABC transporter substrate-binding protein n=1 Tax=Asanoa iriomotensis TaxID=234613 RepID=A0ABQ4BX80_9ACTN|nr:extracellular solute-binding protein [Asanoa iriomotensis]GIF55141.1 ABC transporter substrate-binding protein [Asanoa iriomotensis]